MRRIDFIKLLALTGCTKDMILPQHGILTKRQIPQAPPSYPAGHTTAGSYAVTAARQTTLEPGSGGVDVAMSWSCWMWINNYSGEEQTTRAFGVYETNSNLQQYVLQFVQYSSAVSNQKLSFAMFNAAGTSNIAIATGSKVKRARWMHVCITYSGSELNTGLKIYLNGIEDATAVRTSGGSYAGVGSSSVYRFMISNQNDATRRLDCLIKDLAVWNKELSAAEVTELFNGDVVIAPSAVSFYATAIRAYYPLSSDTTCTNNAALNLTNSGTLITFTSYPISSTYQGWFSCYNGIPSNTRYLSFGSLFKVNGTFMSVGRSGTSHLSGGKIVRCIQSADGFTVTGPTDVIPFANDLRTGNAYNVGANIIANIIEENNGLGTVIQNTLFTSTDGLTGSTYDAGSAITTPETQGGFYGKIVEDYVGGEYASAFYAVTGSTYTLYFARFASGSWSFTSIHSASSGLRFVEPALIKCGNNTYIILARRASVSGDGLYLMYSTDGGSTWSSPANTNLTAAQSMADGCITASGRLTIIWADRDNATSQSGMYYSPNNMVADVIADPTDWVAPTKLFNGYATDSLDMLGYPAIVADGYFAAISFYAEFSSSRADIIFGYGQIDPG